MVRLTSILILALTAVGFAEESKFKSGAQGAKLDHNGGSRTYRLYLPKKREDSKPLPLVIVLHGLGADGYITEALTGFDQVAEKQAFAVAYPDGESRMWRFWEGVPGQTDPEKSTPAKGILAKKLRAAKVDDVGFLSTLIDHLVKERVADARRVYVCGISNGAFMTNRLACGLNDKVAAIGLVAGSIAKGQQDKLAPKRAMPVIYFQGTADGIVGYDGSFGGRDLPVALSAEELVSWWAKQNRCPAPPRVEKLRDAAADGTTVERRTFTPDKGGAPVVFYKIEGGGHTWPSGSFQPEFLLGKTSREVDASAAMWEFFSQHQLPTP